ncbi:MAG: L-rhamnose isomerase [Eubacteriales bacterium]|nr:L-rhamnose isomerase [Eubacteriales bacterium]MDD3881178.1 L-rhamnose isomerase [Eubacteriales bacterium]MDD4511560.1 L-rhamnose isomerase [Eubacteriales bacterium]
MTEFEFASARLKELGVDAEKAIETLAGTPISIHCWQGDDVVGLEKNAGALSGGIQTTGNYPYKARNFSELCADFDKALTLIPGKNRLNLHASYAVTDSAVPRDELKPEHFKAWVDYAKKRSLGLDFNPTCFSHPMVKDNLTLSSPDKEVREFWIRHCIASRRIAAYFAKELNTYSVCNVWVPDGFKDIPADRLTPRLRLKESLDRIFEEKLTGVIDCVESKVFGIGVEACTVGSNEFYMSYAASHSGVYNLLDNGHYHPTEVVSDKIPALLAFFDKIPLHVTRPVRWDSDHVVRYEDEIREIACEIVRNKAMDKVLIGLDYFDASINRVAAWVIGARNAKKALLFALLQPNEKLMRLQENGEHTELLMLQEECRLLPVEAVWEEFCRRMGVKEKENWFDDIKEYERKLSAERI